MANRFPLIFNSGAGQIQELAASDNLDLTSSNLVNAGILFTSSGSATAPSLQIGSGATYNPGLYSPGTDQLAISTNGTSRLSIDASGNIAVDTNTLYVDAVNNKVGVGTATPATSLHLLGANTAARGQLSVAGNAADPRITLYRDGSFIGAMYGDTTNGVSIAAETGYSITFNPGGTSEKARFDSSGRLLVGTSSAVAGSVTTTAIIGSQLTKSTGLRSISQGGTLDLDLSEGTGIVGHLYISTAQDANAAVRTHATYFISTRQGNNTAITLLNSNNGSTAGSSFTLTNPSANIFRFTDTAVNGTVNVSMSFVGTLTS